MFEKISKEQWMKDMLKNTSLKESAIEAAYENIKLPTRGSKYSAGYDFYIPYDFTLGSAKRDVILTGIRWVTELPKSDEDNPMSTTGSLVENLVVNKVMLLFARSSVAKECGFSLSNKVGVIDMDYWTADNEGHIMALVDRSTARTDYAFKTGDRIVQGVILPFHIEMPDIILQSARKGGFGSSGK